MEIGPCLVSSFSDPVLVASSSSDLKSRGWSLHTCQTVIVEVKFPSKLRLLLKQHLLNKVHVSSPL